MRVIKPSFLCSLGSMYWKANAVIQENWIRFCLCRQYCESQQRHLMFQRPGICVPKKWNWLFASNKTRQALLKQASKQVYVKFIYPKYSKHWPYTVTHTIDCVCSKMLNHSLNHGLFLSLFKLIPCPIHWIVYVLAYLNFIFEF